MSDFTLVIPTYNRPAALGRLLRYLSALGWAHRVLVLDSSRPAERESNRRITSSLELDLTYAEYPVETHPFDKFRDGVDRVQTPFCALCADDDVILPSGSEACIRALRQDPGVAVAHGYSFMFLEHPGGRFDLVNVLYFTPSLLDGTPLARLLKQFDQYQATTYSHYRTEALRSIFHAIRPVESILGRELLSGALSVVAGKVVRLPQFSNGRGMGPSASYDCWHPLEWFAKDAPGLFGEYARYRAILLDAVLKHPDNRHDTAGAGRIIDLIHLVYMVRHAPPDAVRFMADQELAGAPFATYWPDHKIQIPLIEASGITAAPAPRMKRLMSRFFPALAQQPAGEALQPDTVIQRGDRPYYVHQGFAGFCTSRFEANARQVVERVCDELDRYGAGAAVSAAA
jgi:glycosyltransferase domain-containing protein